MKDKDFDDIGKRLYDLEADPPKDGWDKIGPILKSPPQPGTGVWLRKHWWKPLVLLIPVVFYTMHSIRDAEELKLTSFVAQESVKSLPQDDDAEKAQTETTVGESPVVESKIESASAKSVAKKGKSTTLLTVSPRAGKSFSTGNLKDSEAKDLTIDKDIPSDKTKKSLVEKVLDKDVRPSQSFNIVSQDASIARREELVSETQYNVVGKEPGDKVVTTPKSYNRANVKLLDAAEILKIENNIANEFVPLSGNKDTGVKNELMGSEQYGIDNKNRSVSISPGTLQADSLTVKEKLREKTEAVAVDSISSQQKEEEEKKVNQWRVTASFSPQFLTSPVAPVTSDEVLVTGVDDSKNFKNVGYGFSIGVGKAITPNFFIDGHLSFTQSKQDIYFSYATGKVDTLIATQLPDQSVRISPVYEIANREIASRYSYGGLRVGATYYFWSTTHGRFNFNAIAGLHYLLASETTEKINGEWSTLPDENPDKVNYNLMIGAGYNLNLNKGWELMINPSLTFFLKDVKVNNVPYNINQRSVGLNIMLSKTLRGK